MVCCIAEVLPRRLALVAALAVVTMAKAARCQSAPSLPTVHAAFAAMAKSMAVPGIAWLCGDHLPSRPEWPPALDAAQPFTLVLSGRGVTIRATEVALPIGVVAAGSCAFEEGPALLWSCASDGTEDWYVPLGFTAPAAWTQLLDALDAEVLDTARTIDLPVVVGHLAGACIDGDPRAAFAVGAALCGNVTWLAWKTKDHLRVRGRSGGGLSLPFALLLLASSDRNPPHALSLRAFAARDDDRAEAARQLSRADDTWSVTALRALLHAEDAVRLAAIDALVRRRANDELPRIVAAAGPSTPWAALAAAEALRELWPDASPAVRQHTRVALAKSDSITLRGIDPNTLSRTPGTAAGDVDVGARMRALLVLGLAAVGLYGLWARERARLRQRTS